MTLDEKIKNLKNELEKESHEISTDSYPMSIGEILSNYEAGEINLSPAFQRLYRWKNDQKSKFIESIFLGIPIPSIFVSQQGDGTWNVVDGVQRLSTILEFTNNLKTKTEELSLSKVPLLPSLEGMTWEQMPIELKRKFRKEKLTFNIIKTENSLKAQYELFQRLNTGGTFLSPQEIRNCLLIMVNTDFYNEINSLKNDDNFKTILNFNDFDRRIEEEYPMELIVRYFIGRGEVDFSKYDYTTLIAEFFDSEIIKILNDSSRNIQEEIKDFKKTCIKLSDTLGERALNRIDTKTHQGKGGFSTVVFDLLIPGISLEIDKIDNYDKNKLNQVIYELFIKAEEENIFDRGLKAVDRFEKITKLSKQYFKELGEK